MREDILGKKEQILQWIEEKQSKAFICRELNCKPETLNSYLNKMGIEYKGNQAGIGLAKKTTYVPALEYLKQTNVKSHLLKQKLIRDGIKEAKCEICGLSIWMGKPIPLELHHKDGNHYKNELDNLQILCPNCHAQQPGNSGANIKNAVVLEQVDNSLLESEAKGRESSSLSDSTKKNYCIDCGREIKLKSIRCEKCNQINQRIVSRPNRNELKNLIRKIPFTKIGEMYEVSDNAIRKWCKAENLPYKSSEIKKMSDKEWELI